MQKWPINSNISENKSEVLPYNFKYINVYIAKNKTLKANFNSILLLHK